MSDARCEELARLCGVLFSLIGFGCYSLAREASRDIAEEEAGGEWQ